MAKSTELAATPSAALVDWSDKETLLQIRESYGKNLNDGEWKLFMGLGMATKLNPFLREIWAVKYGNNPASVFVGRDGYRRSAQAHPEYEYHYAMAVYANDGFSLRNGQVEHEFSGGDRGALIGAYCVVKRKSASKEAVTYVTLSEYVQKFGVWTTKPATMIVKVAEAQGLRASFQELFAGTYEESENWKDDAVERPMPDTETILDEQLIPKNATETPHNEPPEKDRVIDAQVIENPVAPKQPQPVGTKEDHGTYTMEQRDGYRVMASKPAEAPVPENAIPVGKIRADQTKKLFAVWGEYKKILGLTDEKSTTERKALMKSMFGVDSSVSLDERQADELIERIEGMTEIVRPPAKPEQF